MVTHAGGVVSIPLDIMLDSASVVVGRRLRRGGGGAVHLGVLNGTTRVVLKTLFSQMISGDEGEFWREAQMLWSIRHPHVVQIFGVVRNPAAPTAEHASGGSSPQSTGSSASSEGSSGRGHFRQPSREDELFMVMEFCAGGSLHDVISRGQYNPPLMWLRHARQLARTIAFLHSRGVVHRDLKPSNVLVDSSGDLKVCDLGIARLQRRVATASRGGGIGDALTSAVNMTIGIGTPSYMPPEAMVFEAQSLLDDSADGSERGGVAGAGPVHGGFAGPRDAEGVIDGRAWDVFSLSMVFLTAWRCRRFWPKLSAFQIANALSQGHRPKFSPGMPPVVAALIESMWAAEPHVRPTAEAICATLESNVFERAFSASCAQRAVERQEERRARHQEAGERGERERPPRDQEAVERDARAIRSRWGGKSNN